MSMHLEFEPHSWYMGAAIMDTRTTWKHQPDGSMKSMTLDSYRWHAYIEDGMRTYSIIDLRAHTLQDIKRLVKEYYRGQR